MLLRNNLIFLKFSRKCKYPIDFLYNTLEVMLEQTEICEFFVCAIILIWMLL